jgi:hypothetical protein
MSLEFSYSNWWILLGIILCFALTYWFYYREKEKSEIKKSVKLFLAILRFSALLILLLLFLNPLIKQESITKQKPIIAIGIDNSASIIQNKDSVNLKKEIETQIKNLNAGLEEKFDVKLYSFGSENTSGALFDFKEKLSNPSSFLEAVENNYSNQNIAATIVVSDGIVNEGQWPETVAEKIKGNIFTIALGDTTPIKDASIDRIFNNNLAYLGNTFPVEITIKANDLQDKNAKLKILLNGSVVSEKTLTYKNKRFSSVERFNLQAKQAGIQTYKIVLDQVDDEKNTSNNISAFTIEVLDAKEKILILANAPHPDISAIMQSIESNENYEVVYSLVDNFTGKIEGYSLIILHQVNQNIISKYLQNNVSLFYIGNAPNFQIADLKLPSSNKQTEIEADYNKGFGLFSINENTIATLNNAPPVYGLIGEYSVSSTFQSIIYQKIGIVNTQNPLLAFSNTNGKKIGVFLGDGIWKWRLHDYKLHQNFDAFNDLLRKSIQYLSTKEDKSFFRVTTNKNIKEHEPLIFEAEVYDNTYTLTTEAEVSLELKNENNKTYNYTFSKNENNFNVTAGVFPAGNYSYVATAKYKGQTYKKNGVIAISALLSETSNLVADHTWLYNISKKSGGQLFQLNETSKLLDLLSKKADYKTVNYSQKKLTELINLKWLLGILLLLFAIEWLIRKRNGLI